MEARLAAVAVPENLAAIIDHYIARLGSEQRALLAAAAVCGVEFRVDTVALALERDVASVAHGLRGAGARAGVAHRAACR